MRRVQFHMRLEEDSIASRVLLPSLKSLSQVFGCIVPLVFFALAGRWLPGAER